MKPYYFKVTTFADYGEVFALFFSKKFLKKGEKGKGQYVRIMVADGKSPVGEIRKEGPSEGDQWSFVHDPVGE